MLDMSEKIELIYGFQKLQIQPVKAGESYIFMIRFPDDRKPLTITRALGMDKPKFWTSIPEGRQSEAEAIGPLVTQHYQGLQVKE